MKDGESSPATKILNSMFGNQQASAERPSLNEFVDHNVFGGSFPRAFSPGLSSIGAAGFGGIRRKSNDEIGGHYEEEK